jgi:hypothetical protein
MVTRLVLFFGGLLLVILGILRLAREHLRPGRVLATVLGAAIVAAAGYLFIRVVAPRPTFKEYERRVAAWQCMYLCIHCGNRFCQDT